MYSAFQLARKYFHYYITAKNGKGHGIHSPFVFDFITNVLNDHKKYECYSRVESLRKRMLQDKSLIEVEDFGAGSGIIKNRNRSVKNIAASSLKNRKFSQLLFRIVNYYQPRHFIELGTSLGITTSYLAIANSDNKIITLEGSKNIAKIAIENFKSLGLNNIELIPGDFKDTFINLLDTIDVADMVFVDGNHRKVPTIQYFNDSLKKIAYTSIIIFDDIHWSEEMEEAWEMIKSHPKVTLSIDLFFIGLIFFDKGIKAKQDFVIRY